MSCGAQLEAITEYELPGVCVPGVKIELAVVEIELLTIWWGDERFCWNACCLLRVKWVN